MAATRVDTSRLALAIETQELVLREEQARTAEIQDRIEAARKILETCAQDLEASIKRQSVHTQSIMIYQDMLRFAQDQLEGETSPSPSESQQNRSETKPKAARLGKQHYRILHAIRSSGALSLDELAVASHVSVRQAKLKMAEDLNKGLVVLSGSEYELSLDGADVLKRFEEYRRSKGLDLPSLEESQADDQDEVDPETQNEEEETA